ncbi:hypothetical protein ABZ468_23300 [Streptomyces sp. NPDC005708]|uniref:hypothetical protein n=1 Tax=unclassified Streptomyces TaxID=2593676 RepID=UPI0033D29E87
MAALIAPERVWGKRPGPASALRSLGVVLYAVTEGVSPFRRLHGSVWEYTWTAPAKDTPFPGPRLAIEETCIGRNGVE